MSSSTRPPLNLFNMPAHCISPDVCGHGGAFPNRCATCGHEEQAQREPLIRDYAAQMEQVFSRIDRIIGGPPQGDKTKE
jgi:hypothetical protein